MTSFFEQVYRYQFKQCKSGVALCYLNPSERKSHRDPTVGPRPRIWTKGVEPKLRHYLLSVNSKVPILYLRSRPKW